MNKNLENLLNELKNVFDKKLISVFAYGSNACCDADFDINLMIVSESLNPEDLNKISKSVICWTKKKNPPPVFMDKNEWDSSNDVYALEYSDIKENHKILFGEDIITSLCINRNDLRFQCEQEIKNLLMRLRRTYVLHNENPYLLKDAFIPAFKTSMTVFRSIIRLNGENAPQCSKEILKKVAKLVLADVSVYEKIADFKENKQDISKKDVKEIVENLMISLRAFLRYVNDL